MKIVVAIKNKNITDMIIQKYKENYQIIVCESKIEILEIVNSYDEYILIIREDLNPREDIIDTITKIREKNKNIRVVIMVKEITSELKEKLFAKEIFNIIEGNSFKFEELVEAIENPKLVIYKNKKDLIKKTNIIIVTGTRNSGKTVITKVLAEAISKNKKVLAIDLDFIRPSLDLYLSCDKNYSLMELIKDIMNNNVKKIEDYESKTENPNLKYILNSKNIGIPNDSIIIDIFNVLKNKYDYIIADTSSFMINKMYNLCNIINSTILFVIDTRITSVRDYELETMYLNRDSVIKSKIIINK